MFQNESSDVVWPKKQTLLYDLRGDEACPQSDTTKGALHYDRAERTKRTRFCSFVGIDWADQKHAWALQTPTQRTVESGDLNQTPEGVDAWATELGRRFGGRPIAIALEQPHGALLFMLTKYAHFVLYPIQPNTLVNYRRGFRPSGAKSDPSDATLLLDLLVRHRDKFRRWNPDTVETRTLQFLVEGRRKLVSDKTRYSNRLTAQKSTR